LKKSRIKVFILYFSLLAHLFVGAGSAECVVLCFEADGKVAVEYSRNGTCCSSSSVKVFARSYSIIGNPLDSDNCGTCLDVPILLSAYDRPFIFAQSSPPRIEPVFVLIALPPIPTPQKDAAEGSLLQLSPPSNSTILLQRTVVLLI